MFFVYLLRSGKDARYYVGQTEDIRRRVAQHNAGQVQATRARRPLMLLGYEEYPTRDQARYREYQLKHHSDKKRAFIAKFAPP